MACRTCWGLRCLILVSILGLAASMRTAQSIPIASQEDMPAASTPASDASSAPKLQLLYRTVSLPSGRVGADYKPRTIVTGGVAPYSIAINGALPPGLQLGADGILRGKPTASGRFPFKLAVSDGATPESSLAQSYVMRIVPATVSRRASAASAPPPQLTKLTAEEAATVADLHLDDPSSYKLTPKILAQFAEGPTSSGGTADDTIADKSSTSRTDTPTVPSQPASDQLSEMLARVVDIEYPTRALFQSALQAARCQYYLAHLREIAVRKGMVYDNHCPATEPADVSAVQSTTPNMPVSLQQFYEDLLPPSLIAELTQASKISHPLDQAIPIRLTGAGCGCVRIAQERTYGIYPFWLATEDKQPIDFSLLARIGYLGAVLNDTGRYSLPQRKEGPSDNFIQQAHKHGTKVDLVLYRRNWTALLSTPDEALKAYIRMAANNAVVQADHVMKNGSSLGESAFAYDGLTIFFADTPEDAKGRARFQDFFHRFMLELIAAMQHTKRDYQLNVVVPDDSLGDEGPYNFQDLIEYVHAAEPPSSSKTPNEDTRSLYKGTTDIKVSYLVLLTEPTSQRKKQLRAKLDNTPALNGDDRNAMLNSIVPVFFHPRGEQISALMDDQLKRDLAYMKWNFGGSGFWPVPLKTAGAGANVLELLEHTYAQPSRRIDGLCNIVCPNRTLLRTTLSVLGSIEAIAGLLYLMSCAIRRARHMQRPYLLLLWAAGILIALIAAALLSCDPGLTVLRETNYLLYGVIAVLLALGAYITFVPSVDAP